MDDDDEEELDEDERLRKVDEGKKIIERASKLKYEMARDRALECVFAISPAQALTLEQTDTRRRRAARGRVQRRAGRAQGARERHMVHRAVALRRVRPVPSFLHR